MQQSHVPTARGPRSRRTWPTILVTGLLLWLATVLVTFVTGNTTLLPTIVLLGSFLVPVTFVAFAYEHRAGPEVTAELLFTAFVIGGVLGILGASLLESYLLSPSPLMYVGVGVIEEAVKAAALVLVARNMPRRTARDGLVLGATVGFGFAAFESAGYAMNALVTAQGLDLLALIETEVLRGLLTPVGHGVWTAILGGVLFAASPWTWRITAGVLGGYLGVVVLHALWDSVHGIAIALTLMFTGLPWQEFLLRVGHMPQATPLQALLVLLLEVCGLVVVGGIGLVWLWSLTLTRDGGDGHDREP